MRPQLYKWESSSATAEASQAKAGGVRISHRLRHQLHKDLQIRRERVRDVKSEQTVRACTHTSYAYVSYTHSLDGERMFDFTHSRKGAHYSGTHHLANSDRLTAGQGPREEAAHAQRAEGPTWRKLGDIQQSAWKASRGDQRGFTVLVKGQGQGRSPAWRGHWGTEAPRTDDHARLCGVWAGGAGRHNSLPQRKEPSWGPVTRQRSDLIIKISKIKNLINTLSACRTLFHIDLKKKRKKERKKTKARAAGREEAEAPAAAPGLPAPRIGSETRSQRPAPSRNPRRPQHSFFPSPAPPQRMCHGRGWGKSPTHTHAAAWGPSLPRLRVSRGGRWRQAAGVAGLRAGPQAWAPPAAVLRHRPWSLQPLCLLS